jgi:hypothetical protein
MRQATRIALILCVSLFLTSSLFAQATHDAGFPEERTWLDINGDHIADYCRVVGDPGRYQIACAISKLWVSTPGKMVTYVSLYSGTPYIDRGYPSSGGFYSPGKNLVMYCSGRGNSPNPYILACDLFSVPANVVEGQGQKLTPMPLTSLAPKTAKKK